MAGLVGAVRMVVAGLAALVALGHDIVGDAFAKAMVKHKILANKLAFQTFSLYLARIFDDTALELEDVLKAFVPEESRRFLAADSAGTIHQQVLIFLMISE